MKWYQKKETLSAILLSAVLLLSFTGCTTSAPDGGKSSRIIASEETSSEASFAPSSEEISSEVPSSEPETAFGAAGQKSQTSSTASSSKAEKPASSAEAPPVSEAPVSESPSGAPADSADIAGQIEREILRLVKEERIGLGLGELTWNNQLYQSAKVRSNEMAANHLADNIEHVRPDGSQWYTAIQSAGYSYTRVSENLLYIGAPPGANFDGSDVSAVASEIFNGWKESPGHYENMIDSRVDETGIAVTYDGTDIYATQHFGKQ